MSLFMDRRPRPRRFLVWKTRIFAVGVAVALMGMGMNNPYVTGTALGLLIIGMLLRFIPEPRAPKEPDGSDQP